MSNTQDNEVDILDELFGDRADPIDKAALVGALKPHIRLYADTKEISTTKNWEGLNLQQKILSYMLARLVFKLRGILQEEEEGVSAVDIERDTGLKPGSIRPTLAKLADARLIRADKQTNKYTVPMFAVSKAIEEIEKNGGKSE